MPSTRASRQFEGLIVSNRPGSGSDSFVDIFSPDYGIVGVVASEHGPRKALCGGFQISGPSEGLSLKIAESLWRLDSMSVLFSAPLPALGPRLADVTIVNGGGDSHHVGRWGSPSRLSIQRFARNCHAGCGRG